MLHVIWFKAFLDIGIRFLTKGEAKDSIRDVTKESKQSSVSDETKKAK